MDPARVSLLAPPTQPRLAPALAGQRVVTGKRPGGPWRGVALVLALLLPASSASAHEDSPSKALDLAQHGRPTEAWDELVGSLLADVAGAEWPDEFIAAQAEVSALLLTELTRELDRWPEMVALLAGFRPWPAATPPRVAFLLDRLLADAWRRTGHADQARGLTGEQGQISDWYLIGPFDNERGSGFDVAYPPEVAFAVGEPVPGKERPVRWRLNPGRHHPLGTLSLDDVLRPAQQAVAYLATSLNPLEPGPVDLRLGSSCAFKVFLDGHEVAARKVERPLAPDQDVIRLDLREGWNQLLVKLAVEDGPWQLEARLTHVDGRPALDVDSRSAFCAWPGPSPHEDSIMWWDLEDDPWSVQGLLGGTPADDWGDPDPHAGHDHAADDGWGGDDGDGAAHGVADEGESAGAHGAPDDGTPHDADGGGDDGPASGGGDGGGGDGGGGDGGGGDGDGWPGFGAAPPIPDDWHWPVPRGEPSRVPSARDARSVLAERVDDPLAQRLAAVWQVLVHPDDRVAQSARPFAERAVALTPDDPLAVYLLATAEQVGGQDANEREVNRRLAALKSVLALDPGHVSALLDLAEFSRTDSPLPDRADDLLTRAMEAAPQSWRVLRARADQLSGRRRRAEAELLRERAAELTESDTRTAALQARARRLARLGNEDQALAALWQAWTRDMLQVPLADELVERHIERGELDKALYVVEKGLQAEPFDLRRMILTARRLVQEPGVALHRGRELLMRALDVCHEHEGALADMVGVELERGAKGGAVAVLEELLRLDPGDDQARRQLSLLTREEHDDFETPWRRDPRPLLDLPLPESGNDPLEVLDRTVVWRVHPDGTEHRYEHLVLRVLNQGGVRSLDDWTLSAGQGASLRVHEVRVLRPDGSVENAPAPRGGGSWRRYDLPPLSPGDVVDLEWRTDQSRPDVFGEYFGTRHAFYADRPDPLAPTRRSELVVIAPPDVPLHVAERHAAALEREDLLDSEGNHVMRWVARDLKRPPMETAMPGRDELAPLVDVTTFRDWDAFARWWWSFIEKEFVTTDAMRAKVAELTAGLDTERERIEAIARFVGQEIRYNAWAFGTHGYEPYSAATIFERRFGDCKDKSILLRQMLAEIDVEAIPVLLRAEWRRSEEPLDAAMIGHFNHCIAWLPATDEREGFYLDATADLNPIDYLRADDQGANVLRVSPGGGAIESIPYAPPEHNALVRRWAVDLSAAGDAQVRLTDESNGHHAVVLRSRYGGQQGDLRQGLARELAPAFGTVDIEQVETSELEDIAQPAWLRATVGVTSLWTPEGDLRSLPLVFDPLGLESVAIESPADRRFELVLDRPFAHDTEIAYHLPDGAQPVQLPEPVSIDEPGLLHYRLEVETAPGVLLVRRRFELLERRIGLDDYERFRSALRRVEQAERRTLRVRPPHTD